MRFLGFFFFQLSTLFTSINLVGRFSRRKRVNKYDVQGEN